MKTEYFTYNQICKMYGVTKSSVQHRVHRLGLKGMFLTDDGIIFFTAKQVDKIADCYKINYENHPRKIQIVEMYQSGKRGRAISSILKISVKLTYNCIREYNQTGYVTVESKLNRINYE